MVKPKIVEIEKLLKKYLEDFTISDQNITAVTSPGEHYGSIILAVDLKLNSIKNNMEKKLQLVAKLLPSNSMLRIAFDVYITFKKEVLAYTEAIPTLVSFQKEYFATEEKLYDDLFPKCYGARINKDGNNNEVDDNGVLLFENLKIQGFYTEDRLKGLDADAVRVILKNLAIFHATPIALKLLKPEVFDEKVKPCLVKNKGLEQIPNVGMIFHNSIIEGARDCPDLLPYLNKIQDICDYALSHPLTSIPPPNEPWGTFCHRDFWTSNTMILKKDGKYIQSKILDLQLTRYSSGVRDLVFFLFTSVINSVLEEHYEEFIELYYKTFINTLKNYQRIELEAFSWDRFQKELEEVGKAEMYHVLVMLKPICTERGMVKNNIEDFQDSDWTRKDLLGPNHRRKLKDTVLSFVKRNWI